MGYYYLNFLARRLRGRVTDAMDGTLFYEERWDFYSLNFVDFFRIRKTVFGFHVGSPRTEIAPSPSRRMLETKVKYGRIMENTGNIREKHHLHIFFASWKLVRGPVGAAEADTDLSIFSSDPEAKGSRKHQRSAEVGCG